MTRSTPTPTRVRFEEWPCMHPNAAGMDIGARAIVVAVPPERDAEPVRVFETCTPELHAVVDWLVTCPIDTVVRESTGVYWVPIFELLEQRGLTPYLVNARHVKTVPGRKTAWNDAQWLQKLQALGLLQAAFRPDAEMCVLRTLLRHRAMVIAHRAPPILHLQKTLTLLNMQVSAVLTDSTGVPGSRPPSRRRSWPRSART